MSNRRVLIVSYTAMLAFAAGAHAASVKDANPSEAMPAAPVPIVPLPPALVGAGASIGIAALLRFSRHKRWITLR